MQVTVPLAVFGEHDEKTLQQLQECTRHGDVAAAALMADGHYGYSQPIGGVVAYRNAISPSGVGYDIACGNKAVRTNLMYGDIKHDLPRLADAIFSQLEFGVGRVNEDPSAAAHPIFDDFELRALCIPNRERSKWIGLLDRARNQLGTIGSGNHYVDIFVEQDFSTNVYYQPPYDCFDDASRIWIGVHFGSRGFGHTVAQGFLNMAHGVGFFDRAAKGELPQDTPTVLSLDTDLGQYYIEAMKLAGDYAYAGRDHVVQRVLDILGTTADFEVHNHHNFAWEEEHFGEKLWVVRKGATPLWPDQGAFIGGSMCDIAVIARGAAPKAKLALTNFYTEQEESLFSTVHGAGRVMGRIEAAGKRHRKTGELILDENGAPKKPGKVTPEMMAQSVQEYGIELRGAGLDESAFVYRKLDDVLRAHKATTEILHTLRPIIVCMAGADVSDPFKD